MNEINIIDTKIMETQKILQFGIADHPEQSVERPGVYGIIVNSEGKVALVSDHSRFHLPGGGIKADESKIEALKREVLEETGLVVKKATEMSTARQFCGSINKICSYFMVREFGICRQNAQPEFKVIWIEPSEAAARLDHESHAWGIKTSLLTDG
jgi:8-oxo-dGTP pyrophosphatase MutT (NUDIX family)